MNYVIVGLGNPGEQYENTRHNTGRIFLDALCKEYSGNDLVVDKKSNSLKVEGKIGKEKVIFLAPQTFMNNSGKALSTYVKNQKSAEKLVVIYDDFNLPLGKLRISYDRSSGGHNGLESIIKAVKTTKFVRVRVGVAPQMKDGTAKVPHGDNSIEKFILGKFTSEEIKILNKQIKKVVELLPVLVKEGKEKAMSVYNAD